MADAFALEIAAVISDITLTVVHHGKAITLAPFPYELNGDDLRRDPLQVRKATLVSVLPKAGPGVRLNEHMEYDDGEIVFRHACKMGLEGIVSKHKDST